MKIMNKLIMTLAGLLLIIGTLLKFHQMLSTCVPSWQTNTLGFWESYEFFLIQIPLELGLGVWMVSGLFRKGAWIFGTLAYFGFIFVTLTKAATGAESCGCFGQIHVNPWITLFAIDIPFFLLLAIFRPKEYKLLPPPWPNVSYLLAAAVPTIGFIVLSAPLLVTFKPDCIKAEDQKPDKDIQLRLKLRKLKQELAEKQQEADQSKLQIETLRQQLQVLQQTDTVPVIPDPNSMPQVLNTDSKVVTQVTDPGDQTPPTEKWDWLKYVVEDDVRQQVCEGLVVVMIHRYDCEVCAEMVPRYSAYYQQLVDQGTDEIKIAFLAIPPYAAEDHVPDDTICINGKLTDKQKWELMSPYVVALLDGERVKTWEQGTAPEPDKILEEIFEP